MTVTLYIAGPMTGLPEENFPAFFAAEARLKACGYTVLNPADRAGRTKGAAWSWYLRRGVEDVTHADGVATLPDWGDSRGACLEMHVARELGLLTSDVDGWVLLAPKLT